MWHFNICVQIIFQVAGQYSVGLEILESVHQIILMSGFLVVFLVHTVLLTIGRSLACLYEHATVLDSVQNKAHITL